MWRQSLNFFTALGDHYGAGIAGKCFALELSKKTDLRLSIDAPPEFNLRENVTLEKEANTLLALAGKPVSPEFPSFVRGSIAALRWACPSHWPRRPMTRSTNVDRTGPFVAHVFFEFTQFTRAELDWLREADLVTSGSDWAGEVLAQQGITNYATVHQGVELDMFRPLEAFETRADEMQGKFVVFTGGKFEYRKGVDLAIAAFAIFRSRHPDAFLLINAFNPWPTSQLGLAHSPCIKYSTVYNYPNDFERLLLANGLPRDSFKVIGPSSRFELAKAMRSSDCGLFPIRCEGGTNHFVMEYMACGKPLIATYATGLKDILRPGENCVALQAERAVPVNLDAPQPQRGTWKEPCIEEIANALEVLYKSREYGKQLGHAGSSEVQRFSWSRRADHLLEIIRDISPIRVGPNPTASLQSIANAPAIRFEKSNVETKFNLLVVADESQDSVPFAFGPSLAKALGQVLGWNVNYCSVGPFRTTAKPAQASVVAQKIFRSLRNFLRTLADAIRRLNGTEEKVVVVVSGSLASIGRIVRAISQAELRTRVVLVVHYRVQQIPMQTDCRTIFNGVDAIVSESEFGLKAILALYAQRHDALPCPIFQIPRAIDLSAIASQTVKTRETARRERFGITGHTLLIGCWVEKRDYQLGLALHAFRLLVNRSLWHCSRCGGANLPYLDPVSFSMSDSVVCANCKNPGRVDASSLGSSSGLKLQFHILGYPPDDGYSDFETDYIHHMRIGDLVRVHSGLNSGESTNIEELAGTFSALDMLLIPTDCAALHFSMLFASAVGTPILGPNFGEASEYFSGGAELIEVDDWQLQTSGGLRPQIKLVSAVEALVELCDSPARRKVLADAARSKVELLSWEAIAPRWVKMLTSLVSNWNAGPTSFPALTEGA